LHELVNSGDSIAILEKGVAFGGGELQNFGINSNTSANGFIKGLYKKVVPPNQQNQQANNANGDKKLKDVNAGLDEDEEDSNEEADAGKDKPKGEWVALPPFKDLYKDSPLIKMAFEFGPSIIPLSCVGMIFNYTGNHLLHYIHTVMRRKIFYPCHTVTSVQMMPNGEILTNAVRREVKIECILGDNNGGTKGRFELVTKSETFVQFKSKGVIISHGGRQEYNPEFFKWFPCLDLDRDRVMLSDDVLRRKTFQKVIDKIHEKKVRKVVIIGGSHSGFSAAWMLLNGPADILKNTSVKPTVQYDVYDRNKEFKFPGSCFKSIKDCETCCTCSTKKADCGCICKCYGFFKYEETEFDYSSLPDWGEASIEILYRE
jgi:hypothetical protein